MRTLRTISAVLFLLSYFPSSFVVTQYRTEQEAQRLVRASAGNELQISHRTSSEDHYPRYREAKKAGVDFGLRPVAAVTLVPQAGKREFTLFQLYWEVHLLLRVAAVRAPPLQA
jgi:hypothetical protein